MTTKARTTPGKMKGGVRKRGTTWSFTLYLGLQPAQRCNDCDQREWLGPRRLESCPKCGGAMRDTTEPRQLTEGGFPTRAAAEDARAAKRLLFKGRGNAPELTARITLAEYLRDVFLPAVAQGRLKRTTKDSYRHIVEAHLIGPASHPHPIGLVELRKLTTRQIKAHYAELAKGYEIEAPLRTKYGKLRRDRKTHKPITGTVRRKGLSEQTIRRVHAVLHKALEMATTDDHPYLSHNPARGAAKDVGNADAEPRPLPAWSEEELLAFLAATRETPLGALWHVLAYTGMRRAEVLGLQWGDVDLERATLTVRRSRVPVQGTGRRHRGEVIVSSTKGKRVRVIDLDPGTVELLRSLQFRQLSPADLTGEADPAARWVFSDESGTPLNPNTVTYEWRKAARAAGARHIPLHGLRHTHATLLLSAGVPVHIVAKRLGHSTPVITMTTYAHVLPRAQEAAVAVLAGMGSRPGS